jgi:Family of unknown function (DUF5990)
VRLIIRGHHLPGSRIGSYDGVHVGIQVGRGPTELFAADAEKVEWATEIDTAGGDFRGPAVQGRKGDRFVYLTWGVLDGDQFHVFRRAKLMLADLPSTAADEVIASVHLTDDDAMPRCARLRPPALAFS